MFTIKSPLRRLGLGRQSLSISKKHFFERWKVLTGTKLTDLEYCKVITEELNLRDVRSAYFILLQVSSS